jgi:hypothetical protein
VAQNTPRDHATRYLEARVTAWHNDDPPRVEVFRSRLRDVTGVSAPAATAPLRAPGVVARLDELLGREVSLRAFAVLRVLVGPIVAPPPRAVPVRLAPRRTYQDVFHEPYASWYPELPEGPTSACCGWAPRLRSPCRSGRSPGL